MSSPVRDDGSDGLAADLLAMNAQPARRRVLAWLAGAAALPVLACVPGIGETGETGGDTGAGGDSGTDTGAGTDTAGGWDTDDECTTIPEETAGPYPGDGSNGPNALTLTDIVRSDIRTSIGGLTGTAEGIPTAIRLRIVDATDGCTPLVGYAVYLWHCTRDGKYSLYTDANQNYLRGVQVTDADGYVTFISIFPGCYSGRWPHVHFEVYASLAATSSARNVVATSQLALPEAACDEAYTADGYEASVPNFAAISLATDNVFSDGWSTETPDVSGSVDAGFTVSLRVGVGR